MTESKTAKGKVIDPKPLAEVLKKHKYERIRLATARWRRNRLRREALLEAERVQGPTLKQQLEEQARQREAFFKTILTDYDTRPFLALWESQSDETRKEVLDFAAKSFGMIDGFELASRTMTGPLDMIEAGIELDEIINSAKNAIRIAFFEVILKNTGLKKKWSDLAMSLFVAREMGVMTQAGIEDRLIDSIRSAIQKPERIVPERPNTMVNRNSRPSADSQGKLRIATNRNYMKNVRQQERVEQRRAPGNTDSQ